ncbi:MAG TPA: phosphodiester glycosidase family protein [Gemmataceae bacterium]|nr:phosphodiester glycosidase family protein [Gemmataceae bacterium]
MTRFRLGVSCALLVLLAFLAPSWPQAASDYRALEPGLDYKHETKADGPFSIHVLRIDRTKTNWQWCAPLGEVRIMGLSPVTKIAKATEDWQKARAVAAINGDWFEIKAGPYQGDPRGLQIVEGELVSAPARGHCVFWVDPKGNPYMGEIESRLGVIWPDGKTETPLGLNEQRPDAKAVLYTPALGHKPSAFKSARDSTKTTSGRELLLEPNDAKNWLPFKAGKTYSARIAAVREAGDTPLGPNTVVLSLGPNLLKSLPKSAVGDSLTLKLETSPDLKGVRTALGGGLHLVKAGKEHPLDKVDKDRHPRSLFGWNQTHYFLVVVDGRQPKLSVGMSYKEMAALAVRLGCTEAMALDGGGSSTLWADRRVLNSPSDGQPRAVANALILLERKTLPPPKK